MSSQVLIPPADVPSEPDANLLDATRLMVRNGIGHLPVVENGTLVGILTVQDVLKAMQ